MAKKPKLTHRQRRQIMANRAKKREHNLMNNTLVSDDGADNTQLGELAHGQVISRFGKQALVLSDDGTQHPVYIRRTIDSVVCGDFVHFYPAINEANVGVIEDVKDRHSLLTRPDFYDGVKPVAANIDQIIIVSSILPTLSTHIIDRYLVACEDVGIRPVIVINKIDMLDDEEDWDMVGDAVSIYNQLGYQIIFASCHTQDGLSALGEVIDNKISVFVGQSGVGKSSIINALLPNTDEDVGDVSSNSGLGKHTTTASKLIKLKHNGALIDSPGVREFALWHLPKDKITRGFVEFREYLGGCKFSDCRHDNDPGCLIRAAVETGNIDPERYYSYHKIIAEMDDKRPSYAKEV